MNESTLLVIGLAGGVASGKSLVANCFEHFGATVIDADKVGHEVLKDPVVISAVETQWGQIVIRDGEIDRSALARIVFDSNSGDSKQLELLEQITHPRIQNEISKRLETLRQMDSSENRAVVLDAPVMFKAGWDRLCDKMVFVDTDVSIREKRARQRGWSDDELSKREANQTPIEEKRNKSTEIIDNSGSKEDTYQQAYQLWKKWNLPNTIELESPTSLF